MDLRLSLQRVVFYHMILSQRIFLYPLYKISTLQYFVQCHLEVICTGGITAFDDNYILKLWDTHEMWGNAKVKHYKTSVANSLKMENFKILDMGEKMKGVRQANSWSYYNVPKHTSSNWHLFLFYGNIILIMWVLI